MGFTAEGLARTLRYCALKSPKRIYHVQFDLELLPDSAEGTLDQKLLALTGIQLSRAAHRNHFRTLSVGTVLGPVVNPRGSRTSGLSCCFGGGMK